MNSRRAPFVAHFFALSTFLTVMSGCKREADSPTSPAQKSTNGPVPVDPGDSEPTTSAKKGPSPPNGSSLPCVVPLPEDRPREVNSVSTCPPDVAGRPTMPEGKVSFPEAPGAPSLRIEHAVNDDHRAHGLMFRPTLSDDEGMLFSWRRAETRGFWMHNTCLALDMMFLDEKGFILGVVEQVPPMNDLTRSVPCPAAHVLEVRAGWTRAHGVFPGQKVTIDTSSRPAK